MVNNVTGKFQQGEECHEKHEPTCCSQARSRAQWRMEAKVKGREIETVTKGFRSAITEIASHTFNMGKNKFAMQFTELCKRVANYLQWDAAGEGYLVVETV